MKKKKKRMKSPIKQMEKILDNSLSKYMEKDEHERVFSNSNERMKFYHEMKNYKTKKWKTSRNCMYPSCTKKSIINSHTIQKSSSLISISEHNHVLSPVMNHKDGYLHMKNTGIKQDASTFPGYCEEHEKIFDFEQNKEFTSDKHFILQLFRTLCREIVANDLIVDYFERQIEIYKTRQTEVFYEILTNEMKNKMKEELVKSIKFTNEDYRLEILEKQLEKYEKLSLRLNDKYYKPFEDYFLNNHDISNSLKIFVNVIDVEIPLCLAGMSGINEIDGEFFVNVLPNNGNTTLIIASLNEHATELEQYFNYISQNGLTVLTAIESWMVHGTDHWFIKPSVWNRLHKDKREQILNDIFDVRFNIISPYYHSIFDEIRRNLLFLYKKKSKGLILSEKGRRETDKFLNVEEGKLLLTTQKNTVDKREILYKHLLKD